MKFILAVIGALASPALADCGSSLAGLIPLVLGLTNEKVATKCADETAFSDEINEVLTQCGVDETMTSLFKLVHETLCMKDKNTTDATYCLVPLLSVLDFTEIAVALSNEKLEEYFVDYDWAAFPEGNVDQVCASKKCSNLIIKQASKFARKIGVDKEIVKTYRQISRGIVQECAKPEKEDKVCRVKVQKLFNEDGSLNKDKACKNNGDPEMKYCARNALMNLKAYDQDAASYNVDGLCSNGTDAEEILLGELSMKIPVLKYSYFNTTEKMDDMVEKLKIDLIYVAALFGNATIPALSNELTITVTEGATGGTDVHVVLKGYSPDPTLRGFAGLEGMKDTSQITMPNIEFLPEEAFSEKLEDGSSLMAGAELVVDDTTVATVQPTKAPGTSGAGAVGVSGVLAAVGVAAMVL